jgi:hypothetical protein
MIMRASVSFDGTTLEREVAESAKNSFRATDTASRNPSPKFTSPAVQLARGCVFSQHLEKYERVSVTVTTGYAWITMEGDAEDYVLTANDAREFTGPGLLVIEGLEQGAQIKLQISGA